MLFDTVAVAVPGARRPAPGARAMLWGSACTCPPPAK